MKKILSLALAIVFMFALAIPAFAADPAQQSKEVTATYTVSGNYVMTIPNAINANTGATVEVTGVLIEAGKKVSVTVASTNEYNFKYYGNGAEAIDTIAYTLKVGGSAVVEGKIIDVNAGTASGSAALTFDVTGSPIYQGAYTDTLTFTAKVVAQ